MAQSFHQLLAASLRHAKKATDNHSIKSEQLSRIDRERLMKTGCLQKIVCGCYLLCTPHTDPEESTPWYASFFNQLLQEAEIALRMLEAPGKILHFLLKDGMVQAAGRIIGALRHLKNSSFAEAIFNAMQAEGFTTTENNPYRLKAIRFPKS